MCIMHMIRKSHSLAIVSSIALRVGNPDPELIRRVYISTSTQRLGPFE